MEIKGNIRLLGEDLGAVKAVQEGRLEVSVSQATERQSQMAIDIAMKLYRGETVPAENLVEGEGIDKNTVDPAGSTTYRFEPGIIFIVPVRVGRDGIRSSYAFWN